MSSPGSPDGYEIIILNPRPSRDYISTEEAGLKPRGPHASEESFHRFLVLTDELEPNSKMKLTVPTWQHNASPIETETFWREKPSQSGSRHDAHPANHACQMLRLKRAEDKPTVDLVPEVWRELLYLIWKPKSAAPGA